MAHSLDTWHTTQLYASSPLPILAVDDAQDSEKGQVQSLGRPQRSPALQKKWQFSNRWWTFSSLILPKCGTALSRHHTLASQPVMLSVTVYMSSSSPRPYVIYRVLTPRLKNSYWKYFLTGMLHSLPHVRDACSLSKLTVYAYISNLRHAHLIYVICLHFLID